MGKDLHWIIPAIEHKLRIGDGCWESDGGHSAAGYTMFRWGGTQEYGHRVMYELMVGPIPDGMELDHLCRNRGCARPDHLEAVTHAENMARGAAAMRTHCPHGHAYTPENTYIVQATGGRQCKRCSYERNKARREASYG